MSMTDNETGGEQSVPVNTDNPLGIPMPDFSAMMTPEEKSPYSPPPREIFSDGKWQEYDGPGVVDGRGQFVRFDDAGNPSYYDLDNDPIQLYYGMSPESLTMITDVLDRKGYSVNTAPQVQSAIANIMLQANVMGRDFNHVLRQLDSIVPDKQTPAPRYRVSAAADIRSVAHEIARRTLGRRFTEEEVDKFVQSYQATQVQAQQAGGGVSEQAPSADVAAEQYAMQVAPTEAQGYKFLGKVDSFMNMMRGRF
jgi:hypothetical protein